MYEGKTKNVYRMENGNFLLHFKDDVTGQDGVFDPGSNTVGLVMEGAGRAGLRLSRHFFEILREKGIPTHYIDANLEQATMTVKPAEVFGKGLEVICRYRATGSFYRRYGLYVKEGQPLDCLVEFTLKDDARQDPPITGETLAMLGLLTPDECHVLRDLARSIARIVCSELLSHGIELYDIKFEFGRVGPDRQIALIDEISGGNMRAYQNGRALEPLKLADLVTGTAMKR